MTTHTWPLLIHFTVNDILYTLRDTQAEVMVQQKSLIGASLHTTNTHMFVINRDRSKYIPFMKNLA